MTPSDGVSGKGNHTESCIRNLEETNHQRGEDEKGVNRGVYKTRRDRYDYPLQGVLSCRKPYVSLSGGADIYSLNSSVIIAPS